MSLFEASSSEILVLAAMLVIVLILLATLRGKKQHLSPAPKATAKQRRTGSEPYRMEGLSPFDRDVLSRLSWLLKDRSHLQRLARDQESFIRAAGRALSEGLATEDELRTLARHLGLDPNRIGNTGLSTLKLGSGLEISVADPAMNSGAGELTLNHPSAMKVKLRSGQRSFPPGRRVDVICKGRDGLYRFQTTVQAYEGKRVLLDHTSELERVQRRKHRRRGLRIPVELRVRANGTVAQSRTLDISLGGTAVRNPRRILGPAQKTTCVFTFANGDRITIPATVVRTSRSHTIAHLRFERADDAVRHKLFRAIIAGAKK